MVSKRGGKGLSGVCAAQCGFRRSLKIGFLARRVSESIKGLLKLSHISVVGLMTMAPKDDPERAKNILRTARVEQAERQVGFEVRCSFLA